MAVPGRDGWEVPHDQGGMRDVKDQLMRVNLQVVARECGRGGDGRGGNLRSDAVFGECAADKLGVVSWADVWEEEQDALEMEYADVCWKRPLDRGRRRSVEHRALNYESVGCASVVEVPVPTDVVRKQRRTVDWSSDGRTRQSDFVPFSLRVVCW